MGHDVFISHAFTDGREAAGLLSSEFESRHGLSCFTAMPNKGGGQGLGARLAAQLSQTGVVVALLTDVALTSPHVVREIAIAGQRNIPIIPVRLTETAAEGDLEYWLAGLTWAEYLGGLDEAACAVLAENVSELLRLRAARKPSQHLARYTIPFDRVEASTGDDVLPRAAEIKATSATPACIIMLVDCSKSMNRRIGGGTRARRAVVTDQINMLLESLVDLSISDSGVRPYFSVAAIGYGDVGQVNVGSLLWTGPDGDEIVSVVDLDANVLRWVGTEVENDLPDGSTEMQLEEHPIWIEDRPFRRGDTWAKAAFTKALELCRRWVEQHPGALPPIVLNITDGAYTDGDPAELIRTIQEIATPHGNALVFNCHLSDFDADPTFFPDDDAAQGFTQDMARLFEQSSPLPKTMLEKAREQGYVLNTGARGYVYNAETIGLVDFFRVGTIAQAPRR